jgi:uncharacterized coiled-coil DUF342 family protein
VKTPPEKQLGSLYEKEIEELKLSVIHWRGQAESAWKREDNLAAAIASLKNQRNAEHGTALEQAQEIDDLKKRIRELEEKRTYDCAALGCDRFDDDAFTEGLHEAGKRFWHKEG